MDQFPPEADHVADDNRRRRGDDEVPQMMKKTLIEKGIDEKFIMVIADEQDAINASLKKAE
ncbi:MAG: hypothetical protein QGH70_13820, partial [Nitrospinota bacterium]|nr:hypothetical protein [Nitrospinota bacterium]